MHAHVRVALLQEFGWCHLSAGDLLRAERATGSPDADLINTYIKEGKIVPVEVGTFQKSARQLDLFLVTLRPHL
jgi:adenylate kinase family enzyme